MQIIDWLRSFLNIDDWLLGSVDTPSLAESVSSYNFQRTFPAPKLPSLHKMKCLLSVQEQCFTIDFNFQTLGSGTTQNFTTEVISGYSCRSDIRLCCIFGPAGYRVRYPAKIPDIKCRISGILPYMEYGSVIFNNYGRYGVCVLCIVLRKEYKKFSPGGFFQILSNLKFWCNHALEG